MAEPHGIQRLTRVALTALTIGTAAAVLSALPLSGAALAKNNDHGGQGGGHGGGQSDHGGSGPGNGNGGGKGNANGGNANGHGVERGPDRQNDAANSGRSENTGADASADAGTGSDTGDDPSLSPHGLGKLNGFFHASPAGLENASPNSAIGRVAQTFRAALSDFAAAKAADQRDQTDADGTNPTAPAPTVGQLGAILAGATNKPVTAAQVQAIAGRLADLHPEDAALGDFAAKADAAQCQAIADAANAAHAGMDVTTDDDTTAATSASE